MRDAQAKLVMIAPRTQSGIKTLRFRLCGRRCLANRQPSQIELPTAPQIEKTIASRRVGYRSCATRPDVPQIGVPSIGTVVASPDTRMTGSCFGRRGLESASTE